MERSLVDLITNASLIKKLEQSGYESIIDIKEVGVVQITEELQLTTEEVEIILKLVHGGHIVASQTAEARIKADNQKIGISFSCKALDKLFDRYKGVPPSCITELCGEPGSGKTQICMQLAVNAPECIYIDTEGSLFPRRLRQMAETVMMNHNASSDNNNNKTDVDSILNKIHYFRVYDHVQLIALTRQLSNMLDELAQVKLLVLDSITYPLRTNINIKLRNNILSFLGQNLAQLASRHQVAVVVTNYVTEDRLNTAVTPELGDEWGRRCANRFFLYRTREQRYARYYKSSLGTKDTTIRFKITVSEHFFIHAASLGKVCIFIRNIYRTMV
ncbi:P-loop containing nucleoside triphosphate hydrolase protein [Phascolomyces articulosus]|uniref:DNA repair protein RAD51 homolog 3 n=1 Tax=Phascolomyces articulosus TaxID=60185 RepID=A0AAD5K7S7_9FUNG|nr:P-loop containing nucleoside triphosphate hydrolase protein [Phascolomyces articulosus]